MNKRVCVWILSVIILTALVGCNTTVNKASGNESIVQLKLATMTPADHTYSRGAGRFADLVKERSNGRVRITVYADGKLGKGEKELLEAVQQGKIDMYVGSTGTLAGFSPSMGILDIPFLFRDYAHTDMVLDGPVGRQLMTDLEAARFKALAFWENGFRNLTNNRQAVKTPGDARGLTIRTMENEIHVAAWKAVGVNPLPLPWGDVYKALEKKTIDGQENPVGLIYTAKLNDVQKHLSLTQHVYSPAIVIVGLNAWQAIGKSDQEMMTRAATEVAVYERKLGRDGEERQIEELAARGMAVTRDIDKAVWRKAMEPAIDVYVRQFGRRRIDMIVNTR